MSEFWFARRFPVGNKSNALAPISREGKLVGFAFGAAMLVGAAIGAAVALGGDIILGVCIFAVIGGTGGGAFLAIAQTKTDREHTVADYAAGRVRSPGNNPGKGAR